MLPVILETNTDGVTKLDTYYLPQRWEDITYGQYLDIISMQAETELGDQEKAIRIISILVPRLRLQDLEDASFPTVIQLFPHLSFLETAPDAQPVAHVTIDGVNYYPQMIEKMGELAKYDRIDTQFRDNPAQKWPYILALLLRKRVEAPVVQPDIPWYKRLLGSKPVEIPEEIKVEAWENDDTQLQKRAELFRLRLNPVQVTSLAAFFLLKGIALPSFSPSSSKLVQKLLKVNALLETTSGKAMAGNRLWMILNPIFSSIMRFFIRMYLKS